MWRRGPSFSKPGVIGDVDDGYDGEGLSGAMGGVGERTPVQTGDPNTRREDESELTECGSEDPFSKPRVIGGVDNEYDDEGMSGVVDGVGEGTPVRTGILAQRGGRTRSELTECASSGDDCTLITQLYIPSDNPGPEAKAALTTTLRSTLFFLRNVSLFPIDHLRSGILEVSHSQLLQSMPICPKCFKYFKTEKAVTYHRAQPRSACNAFDWNTELVSVSVDPPPAEHNAPEDGSDNSDGGNDISFPDDADFQARFDPMADPGDPDFHQDPKDNPRRLSPPVPAPDAVDSLGRVIDEFPGAGTIFEPGETFLSRFDSDTYASRRADNLYYPFKDLEDWQMANFLITRRLSMSALDEFLSLPAVSTVP